MKMLRPADGSLVIQVRPGIIEYVLGLTVLVPLWMYLADGALPPDRLKPALLVSAGALVCLVLLVEIADFTFDANRRVLRWRRRTALGRQQGELPLAAIRDVTVASHLTGGGDHYVNCVVLSVPAGALALTRYFETGRRSERVARAIREFLAARGVKVPAPDTAVKRSVTALEQDAGGGWWGRLECGHRVPVRHDPPWADLSTPETRTRIVGMVARCATCDAQAAGGTSRAGA